MQTEVLTETEALAEIARLRSLLDAQAPVVEAAIANTDAVIQWRGYFNGPHPPTQREQKARVDKVTETRTRLDEAVNAYRNARLKGRLMAAIERQLTDEGKLQVASATGMPRI